jgi:glycosyltransferase involved in cell wall biosynthesis
MADPIRILELRSVRGTGGGPEKTILLGAEAHAADVEVVVCYLREQRDPTFDMQGRAADLPVDYVEVLERHSFDLRVWSALKRLVADRRIDIVHAHEYKTNLLAWLLERRTTAIALATAHGWTGHSPRERYLYYPADKRLLARYRHVVAVSSQIKAELVRHGAQPTRVSVILNSIDPHRFQPNPAERAAVREELGYRPGDFVIGGVGRVEPQKRFDLLIDAFAEVAARHPEARLALVGDGSLRAELEARTAGLPVRDRCLWLGHRHDVARVQQALDLFVQASDYEGTPNAVLEAMAMETPIVATDAGGTREIALPDVHARIVPTGQLAPLTAAIEDAMTHPAEARARARAARGRVETELSFETRTHRLEAIYRALMSRGDGTPLSRAASHA